jgi:hypothetical protein
VDTDGINQWVAVGQADAIISSDNGVESFAQLPENCFSVTSFLLPILIKKHLF